MELCSCLSPLPPLPVFCVPTFAFSCVGLRLSISQQGIISHCKEQLPPLFTGRKKWASQASILTKERLNSLSLSYVFPFLICSPHHSNLCLWRSPSPFCLVILLSFCITINRKKNNCHFHMCILLYAVKFYGILGILHSFLGGDKNIVVKFFFFFKFKYGFQKSSNISVGRPSSIFFYFLRFKIFFFCFPLGKQKKNNKYASTNFFVTIWEFFFLFVCWLSSEKKKKKKGFGQPNIFFPWTLLLFLTFFLKQNKNLRFWDKEISDIMKGGGENEKTLYDVRPPPLTCSYTDRTNWQ